MINRCAKTLSVCAAVCVWARPVRPRFLSQSDSALGPRPSLLPAVRPRRSNGRGLQWRDGWWAARAEAAALRRARSDGRAAAAGAAAAVRAGHRKSQRRYRAVPGGCPDSHTMFPDDLPRSAHGGVFSFSRHVLLTGLACRNFAEPGLWGLSRRGDVAHGACIRLTCRYAAAACLQPDSASLRAPLLNRLHPCMPTSALNLCAHRPRSRCPRCSRRLATGSWQWRLAPRTRR